MKRVKNSDIKFKINKKLVYLPNFVIRFYTVNQKEYFFEKTQDDLVEYEREATVDDVEVILSGGTTVTEYYLPLNWSELLFVGQGILNYKLTNNIEDPEFPDYQYNKEEVVTTDFYIDSIKVDPEPDEGLIERVVHLEEHLAEEIVNREEADAAISGAVDTEIARAISAETALDAKIDAEETRATSAETALNEALQAETNRAISAETALDAKINQEIADRQTDVNAEEARAISAETALDAKIDAETNRATSAETALNEALQAETNRATSAETALDAKIDQEIADRTADVNAEEARAVSAETALDAKIDAETNRATSAETALQTAINDEATARANADTALQTAITNEVSRAMEAESGITNALNAEVTRATGAENALDDKIDAETTRATSAEAALDVKIGTVSGNVITETTRAITAENALSGAIDSISAATSGSVEELDAKIDQEIADRTADVDAEETRAKGVEDVLSGAIDTLDAKFIDDAKYEMSGQTHVINFYNGNTVKATIDCTDFLVDGMIDDVRIENGYLVIDFNTASGKQDIQIPLTDIFNPNNYYTKSETSGATEIANALAEKLAISDFNTYSGAVDTLINSKASQSTVDALNGVVTAHIADDSIHFTTGAVQTQIDNSISGKANSSDVYLKTETSGATEIANALAQKLDISDFNTYSGNVDTAINSKASQSDLDTLSGVVSSHTSDSTIHFTTGTVQTLIDESISGKASQSDLEVLSGTVEDNEQVTAQALNVLNGELANKLDVSAYTPVDLSNYYTKSETSGATELSTAFATTQPKLSAGTGISIDANNVISATGGGSITVDSALDSGSTNPVENSALFDELRIASGGTGTTDVALTLESGTITNYPTDCRQIKILDAHFFGSYYISFHFYDAQNIFVGTLGITGNNQSYTYQTDVQGMTYEEPSGYSGLILISYPTVSNIARIDCTSDDATKWSLYAVMPNSTYIPLIDQVSANTTSIAANTAALATKQTTLTAGTGIDITSNVISVTGGTGGGISSAECQTMIDQSISGKTNQSDFTAHTANTTVHVTSAERTAWNAKSDFSGSYNDLTDKPTIPTVPTSNTAFTNDAGYITANDITGKTDVTAFTAHTGDSTIHVTSSDKTSWNGAATNASNAVTALGGLKLQQISQSDYDSLQTKDSSTLYIII